MGLLHEEEEYKAPKINGLENVLLILTLPTMCIK